MSSDSDFSQAECNNIYIATAFSLWTHLVRFTCLANNIAFVALGVQICVADVNSIHLLLSMQFT